MVVSRLEGYAMPPGSRLLFDEIELTISLSVNPDETSRCGSTCTSMAGVSDPPTLTFEMPSTCSRSGTISFVTIAESAPGGSVARTYAERDDRRLCRIEGSDRRRGHVFRQIRLGKQQPLLHLHEIRRLIRGQRKDGADRRLALLHRRVDMIEIGRAGDGVFDRLDDRVANLGRRAARDSSREP